MILSASRRTDIPAWHGAWFLNRLRAGRVLTRNPMNHSHVTELLLSPETVDCIVFWTKDPAGILNMLDEIDAMGYRYCFQFTLTPYDSGLERHLRPKPELAETFRRLSARIGRQRVLWRYDPVILNRQLTAEYHAEQFRALCEALRGYTERCTISFVSPYPKLGDVIRQGVIREISPREMAEIAAAFSPVAADCGISLRSCCESVSLAEYGVLPGACIDREVIEAICGYELSTPRDQNQRPGCGCVRSVDIGKYNTCGNGCVYCYANYSDASVLRNLAACDPDSEMLADRLAAGEAPGRRPAASDRKPPDDQIKFF